MQVVVHGRTQVAGAESWGRRQNHDVDPAFHDLKITVQAGECAGIRHIDPLPVHVAKGFARSDEAVSKHVAHRENLDRRIGGERIVRSARTPTSATDHPDSQAIRSAGVGEIRRAQNSQSGKPDSRLLHEVTAA